MNKRAITVLLLAALFASSLSTSQVAQAQANCNAGAGGTHSGVKINGFCLDVGSDNGGRQHTRPTETISCGKAAGMGAVGWNPACGAVRLCYQVKPGLGNVQTPAFGTVAAVEGKQGKPVVWCPGDSKPAVTTAAIRAHALRLLPNVTIGSAWTTTALVNAEVILWAESNTHRGLPTVTILGQRVALRIDQPAAHWDFGDGSTAETSDLGKPYDASGDPCRTAQCPHYYGHTYRHTGGRTIALVISWHAQYSLNGAGWNDIAVPITGPTDRHAIIIKQARGILTPNPGGQ